MLTRCGVKQKAPAPTTPALSTLPEESQDAPPHEPILAAHTVPSRHVAAGNPGAHEPCDERCLHQDGANEVYAAKAQHYNLKSSRKRLVCCRLTGTSVCFLSFILSM
jgi:hypothetical protein